MSSILKAGWRTVAIAALASVSIPSLATAVSMPAEQYQGPVGFITGGIGDQEAKLFEQQMPKHALAIELLEHAGKANEYTADTQVRIADMHGRTVLDTTAGGPFMLVDLPAGRYSIVATLKGDTLKKSTVVVAHDQSARATFEFPAHTD
jgi:hypothetical protein